MSSSSPQQQQQQQQQQQVDPPAASPIHVSAGQISVPAVTSPAPAPVAISATTSSSPPPPGAADVGNTRDPAVSPPAPSPVHDQPQLVGDNVQDEDIIEAAGDDDNHSADSNEFEPEEWDASSSNASTSITSSIYNHTYENGRRYHSYKHGRYPIPNDDFEQSREDMKHAMMLEITDGKLFYAPIGDYPQKVIDIGTGTGIWAIEMGDKFPSAEVMGIDLSPIQPVWLPPNVKFLIDDCEDEWLNGDGWDLVHLRTMSAVLKDVPKMCAQAYAHLRPGGWVEWQELHAWMQCDDGTMPAGGGGDPAFDFYKLFQQAFRRIDCDTGMAAKLDGPLKDAGFVNVQCVVKKIPVGQWARDKKLRLAGWYLKTAIQDVLPALCGKPLALLGLNEVERELWRAAATRAINDDSVHRYWNMYFWYAQKPE